MQSAKLVNSKAITYKSMTSFRGSELYIKKKRNHNQSMKGRITSSMLLIELNGLEVYINMKTKTHTTV